MGDAAGVVIDAIPFQELQSHVQHLHILSLQAKVHEALVLKVQGVRNVEAELASIFFVGLGDV